MQAGRIVLLDHESPMFGGADLVFTARLCGLGKISFRLILGEIALTGHEFTAWSGDKFKGVSNTNAGARLLVLGFR